MIGAKRGGSVLNFIVVTIVLVGLIAGGVFLLRQQIAQPQDEAVSDNSPVAVAEDEVVEAKKPPMEVVHELPGVEANELPQTGPAESFMMTVALGAMSFVAVSYVRSRRSLSL